MNIPNQETSNSSIYRRLANIVRRHAWLAIVVHGVMQITRPKYSIGAVGVIFNSQHQVLLVEHVLHPKTPWGLPGGWGNRNEDPSQTVAREIFEELSVTVEVRQIVAAQVQYRNHLDLAYLCYTTESIGKLSKELLDYRWFNVDNMPRILSFHYLAIQQALKYQRLMEGN